MHITIVEDESILAKKIQKKLEKLGYTVTVFLSYKDCIQYCDGNSQFYILDIGLRDGSGFDIITWLRTKKQSNAPIIIISGYEDSQNIIYGLNIGADDYITKPFMPEELLARIRALLRRPAQMEVPHDIHYKNLIFHPETKEVTIESGKVLLVNKELLLLDIFLRNIGKIISRESLVRSVWWAYELEEVSENTINATISKLRKKLNGNFNPRTIYNEGYLLEEDNK